MLYEVITRRRVLAVCLVVGINAVAKRAGEALVEDDGHVPGLDLLQETAEEPGKTVQCVDRHAIPVIERISYNFV